MLRTVISTISSGELRRFYVLNRAPVQVYRYYNPRQGELRASQLEAEALAAQLQALKMQLHRTSSSIRSTPSPSLVHKNPDAATR